MYLSVCFNKWEIMLYFPCQYLKSIIINGCFIAYFIQYCLQYFVVNAAVNSLKNISLNISGNMCIGCIPDYQIECFLFTGNFYFFCELSLYPLFIALWVYLMIHRNSLLKLVYLLLSKLQNSF